MLLAASALMITGGTCGSGLMIILVSRYIGEREQDVYKRQHRNMSRGFYLPNPADGHILSEKMIIMKAAGISS